MHDVMTVSQLIVVRLDLVRIDGDRFAVFCNKPDDICVTVFAATLDDFVIANQARFEILDSFNFEGAKHRRVISRCFVDLQAQVLRKREPMTPAAHTLAQHQQCAVGMQASDYRHR